MADAARGQVVGSAAEVYESFFVPALFAQWPDTVLDAAGVRAGVSVLDVGCGTGVLARAAQRRVGKSGRVVGLDPNPGMLAVARRSGAPVEWVEGMAEALPFADGAFSAVVSQFAAMFFTDPRGAIREAYRVLEPGGGLAVATWASIEQSPGYAAMLELLRREVGRAAAEALLAPFTIGTVDELRDLIGTAFEDVEVTRHEGRARFPSLDSWLHTDIRGWTLAEEIDDDAYENLLAAARVDLRAFVGPEGRVDFAAPALVATARRATPP